MSQSKHTPGPWDYWDMDEFGFHVFADKYGTRDVGQDCNRSVAAIRYGREGDSKSRFYEAEANARLIAAAPDLLGALLMAKATIHAWHGPNAWEIYDRSSPEMTAINAAIAKATGAQP